MPVRNRVPWFALDSICTHFPSLINSTPFHPQECLNLNDNKIKIKIFYQKNFETTDTIMVFLSSINVLKQIILLNTLKLNNSYISEIILTVFKDISDIVRFRLLICYLEFLHLYSSVRFISKILV